MLPLYAARIEDLGPGDFVKVDCAACHHVVVLAPDFLLRLGLSPKPRCSTSKSGSGAGGAGREEGRWFRSSGGDKAGEPVHPLARSGVCARQGPADDGPMTPRPGGTAPGGSRCGQAGPQDWGPGGGEGRGTKSASSSRARARMCAGEGRDFRGADPAKWLFCFKSRRRPLVVVLPFRGLYRPFFGGFAGFFRWDPPAEELLAQALLSL
jgi:hypothetical protein